MLNSEGVNKVIAARVIDEAILPESLMHYIENDAYQFSNVLGERKNISHTNRKANVLIGVGFAIIGVALILSLYACGVVQ